MNEAAPARAANFAVGPCRSGEAHTLTLKITVKTGKTDRSRATRADKSRRNHESIDPTWCET
jgi:hypothetical protein